VKYYGFNKDNKIFSTEEHNASIIVTTEKPKRKNFGKILESILGQSFEL